MIDLNQHREQIIDVLNSIRTDAQMALDGDWDCTTEEGIETGFTAQIDSIDDLLSKIEDENKSL